MLRVPFIASALAIIAFIIVVLIISLVQGQRHLRTVQKELSSTNEHFLQVTVTTAELEKTVANLKAKACCMQRIRNAQNSKAT